MPTARSRCGAHETQGPTVAIGLAPHTAGHDKYSATTALAGAFENRPDIAPSSPTAGAAVMTRPCAGSTAGVALSATGTHVVVGDSMHGACCTSLVQPRSTLSSTTKVAKSILVLCVSAHRTLFVFVSSRASRFFSRRNFYEPPPPPSQTLSPSPRLLVHFSLGLAAMYR